MDHCGLNRTNQPKQGSGDSPHVYDSDAHVEIFLNVR